MRMLIAFAASLTIVGAFVAYRYSRAGLETPDYEVIVDSSPFQLREYPDMTVVTASMGDWDLEQSDSFMRLFRYISGENEDEQKISMTTPVFMSRDGGSGRMSFIVPQEVARNGAPAATSPDVEVETMSGGRFAAYRFSGERDRASFEEARGRLEAWIEEQGWESTGPVIVAGYDPPYTPASLRRNEVLLRIAG